MRQRAEGRLFVHHGLLRAAHGKVTAVPAKSAMNSPRFMVALFSRGLHHTTSLN
jgi:hypothetical protein